MENTSRAIIYKHKSDPPCDTEKKTNKARYC